MTDKLNGNGHATPLAVPSDISITEAPRRRRKKHVPIAPAGTVPSGDVEWTAKHFDGRTTTVRAQTWFFARAAAMAEWGCGPTDVEVHRS